MTAWGALKIDSSAAAREVLEHTVVASLAYVSERFSASRDRLGIAWFGGDPHGFAGAGDDPAAPLRRMAEIDELLRAEGASPHWHGLANFVWVMDAPTLASVHDAAGAIAALGHVRDVPLCHGVAHGSEADDPADLLRLAAGRASSSGHVGSGEECLALTPREFASSEGERARLARISENRNREIEPLVREALDLLFTRYA
ncbi:hypothetical protein [Nonomuraea diastatica]|uniref:Uncharacterized protein n=1 Tax=Nonomuraea diastatica TaxID=1848329 RepID=A0A4R4W8X4_9ACTN|nr:hypothetical protein [Nonomuraea diastatica]TDD11645.1 hypothetical protein E1294_44835 [Nonomuraea diastatica]